MKKLLCLLVLAFVNFPCALLSQSATSSQNDAGALAIVQAGFDSYRDKGASAAVKAWIKGSLLEANKDALSQVNNLNRIEELYGPLQSWNLVAHQAIGRNDIFYYAVMNYRDTAVYAQFEVYKSPNGWALNAFAFNSDIGKVFPPALVDKTVVLEKPVP